MLNAAPRLGKAFTWLRGIEKSRKRRLAQFDERKNGLNSPFALHLGLLQPEAMSEVPEWLRT
ncbi:hypothetical protein QM467_12835 [Rhodoblastus sp. 17X3]|uniref:hypothetical protein n=1 Tax=Rhodoblastus sp. 17X3 TaxID=3047026 RepID=UPI0024B7ED84|nr:hypothetical protein [Rhodoblastus sp. 17X3]MDI9848942.1 hypothetical protein [Rhodoblastus sp. 17X3]